MKQYVIDQLRESDYYRITDYLKENLEGMALDGIYWMDLPENLYGETQLQHTQCRPFYFAVNLNRTQIAFEWLIRSRQTLHCSCLPMLQQPGTAGAYHSLRGCHAGKAQHPCLITWKIPPTAF